MSMQLRRVRFLASAAALALVAAAPPAVHGQAQAAEAEVALPDGVTRVASVEGITEYGLDNDLTAEQEEAIRALTIDEVNGAFRRHIDPDAISVFRAGDFSGAEEAPTS